jgi:hypothetical protein
MYSRFFCLSLYKESALNFLSSEEGIYQHDFYTAWVASAMTKFWVTKVASKLHDQCCDQALSHRYCKQALSHRYCKQASSHQCCKHASWNLFLELFSTLTFFHTFVFSGNSQKLSLQYMSFLHSKPCDSYSRQGNSFLYKEVVYKRSHLIGHQRNRNVPAILITVWGSNLYSKVPKFNINQSFDVQLTSAEK